MNKNILLFIENLAVWGGVIAAYAMAILPLVQVIANHVTEEKKWF